MQTPPLSAKGRIKLSARVFGLFSSSSTFFRWQRQVSELESN